MRKWILYLLLAALCGALFFWRLGSVPLIGRDEGYYSEVAREMYATGDLVTPRLDGEYFFDKPPLVYWMQNAVMKAFGVNSLAVRLPSAVIAILLVVWTVFLGNRLFGKNAGLYAGFALASSILFTALSRMALMDMAFSCAISLALGFFILAYLGMVSRWGYVAAWAAMGVSALIKGPAGVVLALAVAGIFLALRRDWKGILRGAPVLGILACLAIALPWYVMVQKATGGAFLKEFIFHQNLQRAMGKDFSHNAPFYVYLPMFAVLFFPWSVFWIKALVSHVKVRSDGDDKTGQAALFTAAWTVGVIGIFSIVVSKLPGYILPAFPGAALLLGLMWSRLAESAKPVPLKGYAIASMIVGAIAGAALVIGPKYLPEPIPGLTNATLPMGICMILGPALALWMLYSNKAAGAFSALCAGASGFLLVAVIVGLPIAARSESDPMVGICRAIKAEARPDAQVFTVGISPAQPAFGFYAERLVLDVIDMDDLDKHWAMGREGYIITQEGKTNDQITAEWTLVTSIRPYRLYRKMIPE